MKSIPMDYFKTFFAIIGFTVFLGHLLSVPARAEEQIRGTYEPSRTGVSINTGVTYDPSEDDISFLQMSIFKLYDYDAIWKHRAPENLRFKVEASAGSALFHDSNSKFIANTGILALLYLDSFKSESFRPFVEAGIGVIFTDFRVTGQDYRFNFNPQAGLGFEFNGKNSANYFLTARAHHVSNGGTGSSNRGLNSVVLMFGRFF